MQLPSLFIGPQNLHILGKTPCNESFGEQLFLLSYRGVKDAVNVRSVYYQFGMYVEKDSREIVLEVVQGCFDSRIVRASAIDGGVVERGTMLMLNTKNSSTICVSCTLHLASGLFEKSSHFTCYLNGKRKEPSELLEVIQDAPPSEWAERSLFLIGPSFDECLASNKKECEELLAVAREMLPIEGMVIPCTVTVESISTDAVFEIHSVGSDRIVTGSLHMVDGVAVQWGTELTHTVVDDLGQEFSCEVGVVTHVGESRYVDAAHL